MASTYSTNLALELIGTGEQSGTWGTTTNTNLGTLLEQAVSGYVTQAITDGASANTTITIPNGSTGVARNMFIEMTGALTVSSTSLIVPANKKMYFIFNNTSGGFAVTVKVSGQTGILVPTGKKVVLACNGTDIVEAHTATVGAVTLGSTLGVTGAATLSSTLDVTGIASFAAGSAAAPAITRTGDLDTGMWFPAANALGLSSGGTNAVYIDSSQNVGIGTSSPSSKLEVLNAGDSALTITGNTASGNYAGVDFKRTTGTVNASVRSQSVGGNDIGEMYFMTRPSSGSLTERMRLDSSGILGIGVTPSAWGSPYSAIQVGTTAVFGGNTSFNRNYSSSNVFWNGSNYRYITTSLATQFEQSDGAYYWLQAASGTAGNAITFTQAMTLDASGNLGIGTSSPVTKFHLLDNGPVYIQLTDSGDGASRVGQNGTALTFGVDAGNGTTERARFNATGALVFAGGTTTADGIGITFPATQSASSNANTLDDYEEGTWTPLLSYLFTVVGTATATGTYTKTGRTVYITWLISISAGGTVSASNGWQMQSCLPFTVANSGYGVFGIENAYGPSNNGNMQCNGTNLYGSVGWTGAVNNNFSGSATYNV